MTVTLVSAANFTCRLRGTETFNFTAELTLNEDGQIDGVTREKFRKLKEGLSGHGLGFPGTYTRHQLLQYGEDYDYQLDHHNLHDQHQQRWGLKLTLSTGNGKFVDVALEGTLLQKLHQLLFNGNDNESLEIVAKFTSVNPHGQLGESLKFEANEMKAGGSFGYQGRGGEVDRHFRYSQQVVVPVVPSTRRNQLNYAGMQSSSRVTWYLTVELDLGGKKAVNVNALLPKVPDKFAKLLKDKLFCDFEIIAANGVSVPCHKAVLSVNSPVFLSKCEGKLKESAPNKMTMELTEDAVNALLEFIYCGKVELPMANSGIALELFQAGHEYHISDMEQVMGAILLQQSDQWYYLDTALLLFQFLVNYEGESCSKLKDKVIQVLKVKQSAELLASEVLQEMFTTPASREMFALLLKK